MPVALGFDQSLTRRGIPRSPALDVATQVAERIATISAPLGAKVARDGTIASVSLA